MSHVTFSQQNQNKETDKIVNEALFDTPEKITNALNSLVNRSDQIGDTKKASISYVNEAKNREIQLAKYAQQLLQLKTQFENEKNTFEKSVKDQHDTFILSVDELTKKSNEINLKFQENKKQIEKNNNQMDLYNQKIDDLHGLDDDLINEEKYIASKIEKFKDQLSQYSSMTTKSELFNTDQNLIQTTVYIEETEKSINIINSNMKDIEHKKVKQNEKMKGFIREIGEEKNNKKKNNFFLKRSLAIQTEKYNFHESQRKFNFDKMKNLKIKICSMARQKRNDKKNVYDTNRKIMQKKDLIKLKKQQEKISSEEAKQFGKIVELMKRCQTLKEFEIVSKLIKANEEKTDTLKLIGEVKVQKKLNNEKANELLFQKKKIERKIDLSNKANDLIKKAQTKIRKLEKKRKEEHICHDNKLRNAYETLNMLNQHYALSEKIYENLTNHVFYNQKEPTIYNDSLYIEIDLEGKLNKLNNENKILQKKIKHTQVKNRNTQNLIKKSKFNNELNIILKEQSAKTKTQKNEMKNNEKITKIQNDIFQLQELIIFHQKNIDKRKKFITKKMETINNISDFYGGKFIQPPLMDIRLCNCPLRLLMNDEGKSYHFFEDMYKRILIEKENWIHDNTNQKFQLKLWNNQIEHML